ncbi:hypothetical protein TWF718_008370 [Orbilia javanica]|uniref:Uncharacterized protein n=1 Tax=Orbilia javanica TaxID=47235 RepID=A0AAN8N581_9PEZI
MSNLDSRVQILDTILAGAAAPSPGSTTENTPLPIPKDTKSLPEITELRSFESQVNEGAIRIIGALFQTVKHDESRLTGTRMVHFMDAVSQRLEMTCQQIEGSATIISMSFDSDAHQAMTHFEQFRPLFLHKEKTRDLDKQWGNLFKTCFDTHRALGEVKQGMAIYRIKGSGTILTADTCKDYEAHLIKLTEIIRDSGKDIESRKDYLTSEKQAAVRLIMASKRFKTSQRNHPTYRRVCSCRGRHWEKAVWDKLGLPAINMTPGGGSKGFRPV